ncbi:hypothetical protein DFQ27_006965 [Actinomortierella ambigua]|uniref:Mss4-like protein n=1 Tax=Actinomortierella ambigua TaxID=1343610 RepID=A0A9P6QKJ4_9FUNG|nr:hypothetical protein DFQ27_006965 [Actinomortierella ambigua]
MAAESPLTPFTYDLDSLLEGQDLDQQLNRFDIYCPQSTCRSLILRKKTAHIVKRPRSNLSKEGSDQITEQEQNSIPNAQGQEDVAADPMLSFWIVKDMMDFDNIGFTKTLPSGIKLLACADCDTGPLGYHDTNAASDNREYLIAFNRVRYPALEA